MALSIHHRNINRRIANKSKFNLVYKAARDKELFVVSAENQPSEKAHPRWTVPQTQFNRSDGLTPVHTLCILLNQRKTLSATMIFHDRNPILFMVGKASGPYPSDQDIVPAEVDAGCSSTTFV